MKEKWILVILGIAVVLIVIVLLSRESGIPLVSVDYLYMNPEKYENSLVKIRGINQDVPCLGVPLVYVLKGSKGSVFLDFSRINFTTYGKTTFEVFGYVRIREDGIFVEVVEMSNLTPIVEVTPKCRGGLEIVDARCEIGNKHTIVVESLGGAPYKLKTSDVIVSIDGVTATCEWRGSLEVGKTAACTTYSNTKEGYHTIKLSWIRGPFIGTTYDHCG
jgi:hypothetical protein